MEINPNVSSSHYIRHNFLVSATADIWLIPISNFHLQVGVKNKTNEVQSKLTNVILLDVNKNQVCNFFFFFRNLIWIDWCFSSFLSFFSVLFFPKNIVVEQCRWFIEDYKYFSVHCCLLFLLNDSICCFVKQLQGSDNSSLEEKRRRNYLNLKQLQGWMVTNHLSKKR